MAVVFSASLGYNLAKAYHVDPLSGAIVSLSAFIMGMPQSAKITVTLAEVLSSDSAKLITDAGWTIADNKVTAGGWGGFPV